ncbi:hypothetical protein [Sphingomonas sp.]|uniref:hypothetical protein n=1 Tax=Sphingomonas sp. TaxID=28214 RepID=UPI0025DB78D7|nr:hypothetical protein [Sphingomonas sp.]
MSACQSSSLVSFLRIFGPSAETDALSDENVRKALAEFGVQPIVTPAPQLEKLKTALCGETPSNVILTGTAGDGKTYHIRQLLLGELNMAPELWPGDAPVLEVSLPSGIPLRVIRDLSELEDDEKDAELAAIIACLKGKRTDVRYLIAANDGQLLRYFRDSTTVGAGAIHAELARMLRSEVGKSALDLVLLNLSRSWSGETVDKIFDAVIDHPDWASSCDGCPGTGVANPCPIRLNQSILRGDDGAGLNFRTRIKDALRVGAANDSHIPIRYLIMLAVNILLGDRQVADDPLLDCDRAKQRAAKGNYELCNPYDNALGLNMPKRQRDANVVFSQLASLGLGEETNNLLDEALTKGEPKALAEEIFATEKMYGERLFAPAHHAYYVTADRSKADEFRGSIATQRRRAFFRMSASHEGMASPWRFTVLHHAGTYLDVIAALTDADANKTFLDQITRRLIKGLNRAYLGMMAEETEKLWLAGTIGRTDDTVGRIATVDAIARATRAQSIKLDMDRGKRRPVLLVRSKSLDEPIEPLELRPLLFEYLLRVDEGSLPSSFSRQCQQEVRQFALITNAAFGDEGDEGDVSSVFVLSLSATGNVDAKTLEV